jgi:uncharacterized protein (TIRG00374 family)
LVLEGTTVKQSQNWLQKYLGIVLSLVCLAGFIWFVRPVAIWQAIQDVRLLDLALGVLGMLVYMLGRAIRWQWLLNNKMSWQRVFHVQNIGYLITYLLPFRLGDVARATMVGKTNTTSPWQAGSTVVVERLLDLGVMVVILGITVGRVGERSFNMPASYQFTIYMVSIIAFAGIFTLFVMARFQTTLLRWAAKMPAHTYWLPYLKPALAGLQPFTHWRTTLTLIAGSFIIWLPMMMAHFWVLRAVHLPASFALAGFITGAAALVVAAPSSPGQVGVFHAGVTAALTTVAGQAAVPSATFALLYHALNFALVVVLGIAGIYATQTSWQTITTFRRKPSLVGVGLAPTRLGDPKSSPYTNKQEIL